MTKKNILTATMILLMSSLLLGACSPQATPALPTMDPQIIYTQAALTVEAGAVKTRTAQPQPATATVAPAATQAPADASAPTIDPNMAAALTATASAATQPNNNAPTATLAPGAPTPTLFVVPTATKAAVVVNPPATNSADKCEWVSNNPPDNAQIHAKNTFNTSIKVRNSGTSTWDKTYVLRYFGGERMNAPSDFYVTREVKPNEIYEFAFELIAPSSTGKKQMLLVVQGPTGGNMCWITLPYDIIE